MPGLRRIFGEGGIQPDGRIHDAQAVGANQAHGTAPQLLLNLPFECNAFGSSLLESGGNDNRRFDAGIHALSDELWDGYGRRGNHSQSTGCGTSRMLW